MITKIFRPVEQTPKTENSWVIRTSRSIHEVVQNEDGSVTVSSYKLSNKWTTSPEELAELVAKWPSAKRVVITEVTE